MENVEIDDNVNFEIKKTELIRDDLINNLNIIKESKILIEKWINYSRNNNYAKKIEFDETVKCLEKFINIIISVAV